MGVCILAMHLRAGMITTCGITFGVYVTEDMTARSPLMYKA